MLVRASLLIAAIVISMPGAASAKSVADGFTFVAAGDLITPPRAFSMDIDPGVHRVAELFRGADVGFANNEFSLFDLATFRGAPAAENGGGYSNSEAAVASSIRAAGINLVSRANNHGTDWGAEGLEATLASLSAAGIVQAGAGHSLAEARAPAYLDTKRGRVALVSTASTFPPMSAAGDAVERNGTRSRPRTGVSVLHVRLIRRILPEQFASLQRAAGGAAYPTPGRDDEVRIGDTIFRKSDSPGMSWEMDPSDETAIIAAVKEARAHADFVIFAIHAHQTAGDTDSGPLRFQPEVLHFADEAAAPLDTRPADFEPLLFHAIIDAGADVVVRTGPHILNGIEIYQGKPIFYSLGSLLWTFGQRRNDPPNPNATSAFKALLVEETSESVVPVTTYRNGKPDAIRLYPIVIDSSGPAATLPRPATGEKARKILERMKTMSAAFGTTVHIENDVGIIKP